MTVWTRNRLLAALCAGLLAGACSGDDDNPPPPGSNFGGSSSKAGASSTSGSPGAAGEAGGPAGGADGAGGADSSSGGDGTGNQAGAEAGGPAAGAAGGGPVVVPLPDPECPSDGTLTGQAQLGVSTIDDDWFGAITPDELAIAWTVVAGEEVTLHYAYRASTAVAFGGAAQRSIAAAPDGVALSSDGLRVVYVNDDRKGFTQLVRSAVSDAFESVNSDDFEPIHDSAILLADDEFFGDPVLRPDDFGFYYSLFGGERTRTLLATDRFSRFAPWPEGAPLDVEPELEATAAARLQPTGVSLDRQMLFLWNAAEAEQLVAVQSHDTLRYELAFVLGDVRGAAPNTGCSRIYYGSAGDLWSATFQ